MQLNAKRCSASSRLLATVVALGTAGLLAGALTATASAHFGHDGAHHVIPAAAGVVQTTPGPAATSFTIQTRGGSTETVDVGGSTTYLERGMSGASLTDVAQGDLVAVFGTVSGTSVTATEVIIMPHQSGDDRPAAAGVVQGSPSGNSFTIASRNGGSQTIDVTGATTYFERGVSSPTFSDIASGDLVAVFGTASGSTVTATAIVIGNGFQHGSAIAGVVQGTPVAGATSFVVQTRGGVSESVEVTGSTRYFERGVGPVTLGQIVSGDVVGVFGLPSGANTVTAAAVLVVRPPSANGNFAAAGTVQTAPSNGSFVIETGGHAQTTVSTTSSTTYLEWGNTGASLSDVHVGEDVAVFGTVSGSTVAATQVVIGGDERSHPGYFGGDQGAGGRHRGSGGQDGAGHQGDTGGSGQQGDTGGHGDTGHQGVTGDTNQGSTHTHGHRRHGRGFH